MRYAVAYDPQMAQRTRRKRQERFAKADRFIKSVLTRLERAEKNPRPRGWPPTVQGAFRTLKSTLELRPVYHWTETNPVKLDEEVGKTKTLISEERNVYPLQMVGKALEQRGLPWRDM